METAGQRSSISAMQLALEALEDANDVARMEFSDEDYYSEAINALRQALETEQEPVAWMHNFIEGNVITHIPADIGRHPERWTALYKDPTPCKTCESLAMAVMNDQTYHEKVIPKREWVGLTEDDWVRIYSHADNSVGRAAELAEEILKDKNGF